MRVALASAVLLHACCRIYRFAMAKRSVGKVFLDGRSFALVLRRVLAEYYMFDHEWIAIPTSSKETFLKTVKDYSDYASKIWAAVLAPVVFLYLKK
jgi:hypothetical protein